MSEEAIREAVQRALAEMGVEDAEVRFEQPKDPSHGDLTTTVALTLAKTLGRSPRAIAEELAEKIAAKDSVVAESGIESASVAGPGFLNFKLSSGQVASGLVEIIAADEDYGRCDEGGGKRLWSSSSRQIRRGPCTSGTDVRARSETRSRACWTGPDGP